jgi:hypothetical protein
MRNLQRIGCMFKVAMMLVMARPVEAQQALVINKNVPYYIDINQSEKSDVYEIQDGFLSLQYHDNVGRQKQIDLKIYNWKLELVATFNLDKSYGLNNYNIDLKDVAPLEDGLNYLCMLTDESGTKHEWNIRETPVNKSELQVGIFVNPLSVECSGAEGNLIEYYGQITQGRGPYAVRWYVLNEARTDFLYQPKEDQLKDPGKTSVVEVDQAPSYYVVMDVTDACGATGRKMIFMTCEENKNTINTVFVEPLQLPPGKINAGN